VLLLVDAAALAGHLDDPLLTDSLTRPLAHADLVLLNHADRASAADLQAARTWVQGDAQRRGQHPPPIAETTQADVPLALLADRLYAPHGGGLATRPADHGAQFQAWQQQPAGCFDEARLRTWLRALPPGVLRLKGWLRVGDGTADDRWLALQWAGRHASFKRLSAPPAGGPALVAIGLAGQLPATALEEGLRACRPDSLIDNPESLPEGP
jgi:G3E family GTPase